MALRRLDWTIDPCDAIERWPRDRPLAALVSRGGGARGRWSIFGITDSWAEVRGTLDDPAARLRELHALLDGDRARTELRASAPTEDLSGARVPFHAGWIGFLSYELGALFEPSALPRRRVLAGVPLAGGWRCHSAVVHDAETRAWWWTGAGAVPSDLLEEPADREASVGTTEIAGLCAEQSPGAFAESVAIVRERIRNGDLFQANIAQRWRGNLIGSSRRLAATAMRSSGARYGAVIESPDGGAIISMSPELFLRCDPEGTVTTRPIKGTRPSDGAAAELMASAKDAAELAMIVDLMRNDLARVSTPGSVRVTIPREIETHPTVHHGVAEICGRLHPGAHGFDLLAATFPPGSVTGAPKVAAMQLIDALEPFPRGAYCGAVGFVGDDGALELNVAIRTITVLGDTARTLLYSAGCGIVSDSDPREEEAESELKRRVLDRTMEQLRRAAPGSTDAGVLDATPGADRLTPRGAAADAAAPRS